MQIKQYNSLKDLLGDIHIFLIKKREIDKFSTTAAIFNQSMQFLLSRECNPTTRKDIWNRHTNGKAQHYQRCIQEITKSSHEL